MKYSPAPWGTCNYPTVGSDNFGIYTENDHVAHKDIALVRNYYDDETNKANARLIAAAPELLRTLQLLYDTGTDSTLYDYALSQARQAIDKATGENG